MTSFILAAILQIALSNSSCVTPGMYPQYNGARLVCTLLNFTQYAAPITGGTVNSQSGQRSLVVLIDPAGTLATLTFNLPTAPNDGDQVVVATSQIITTLTVGNGTIVGSLTSLSLAGFAKFQYNQATTKWFRIG